MMRSKLNLFFAFILILLGVCFIISCNKDEEPEINYSWIPVGYQLNVGNADELIGPINIFFINEQTGFLSNESLEGFSFFKTDDKCLTFVDISDQIDGYVKEICFSDDKTGYLITHRSSFPDHYYSLYKTTDQGGKWIKIEIDMYNNIVQVGSNSPENVFIMCQEPYSFLYSNDGGNTWTVYELELIPTHGLREVQFQFLKDDPNIGFFNNMNSMYKTTNSGESWEKYFEFTSSIEYYWFINDSTAYISYGAISKTTNGGSSFQLLDYFSARYWQVLSEEEIYVAQLVAVQRTFDEFRNLEVMEVKTPSDNKYDKYIRDISFYESKKGYAISGNGFVYKTAD